MRGVRVLGPLGLSWRLLAGLLDPGIGVVTHVLGLGRPRRRAISPFDTVRVIAIDGLLEVVAFLEVRLPSVAFLRHRMTLNRNRMSRMSRIRPMIPTPPP